MCRAPSAVFIFFLASNMLVVNLMEREAGGKDLRSTQSYPAGLGLEVPLASILER